MLNHHCQKLQGFDHKIEGQIHFPTSTPGARNYIYKLPKGLGMRKILAHGTRILKNP